MIVSPLELPKYSVHPEHGEKRAEEAAVGNAVRRKKWVIFPLAGSSRDNPAISFIRADRRRLSLMAPAVDTNPSCMV
jgi:hypothetical protein